MKAVMENGHERGETEVEEREVGETKTETDRKKTQVLKGLEDKRSCEPGSREKAIVPEKG